MRDYLATFIPHLTGTTTAYAFRETRVSATHHQRAVMFVSEGNARSGCVENEKTPHRLEPESSYDKMPRLGNKIFVKSYLDTAGQNFYTAQPV